LADAAQKGISVSWEKKGGWNPPSTVEGRKGEGAKIGDQKREPSHDGKLAATGKKLPANPIAEAYGPKNKDLRCFGEGVGDWRKKLRQWCTHSEGKMVDWPENVEVR